MRDKTENGKCALLLSVALVHHGRTGSVRKFNENHRKRGDGHDYNNRGAGRRKNKPFEGDSHQFKEWIKSIKKYAYLTRVPVDQVKMIAYQSSKGAVSDFLPRLTEYPDHTWRQVKGELTSEFAEVTDSQHALMLLRKVRQQPGENIRVYAEHLLA